MLANSAGPRVECACLTTNPVGRGCEKLCAVPLCGAASPQPRKLASAVDQRPAAGGIPEQGLRVLDRPRADTTDSCEASHNNSFAQAAAAAALAPRGIAPLLAAVGGRQLVIGRAAGRDAPRRRPLARPAHGRRLRAPAPPCEAQARKAIKFKGSKERGNE